LNQLVSDVGVLPKSQKVQHAFYKIISSNRVFHLGNYANKLEKYNRLSSAH